MRQLCLWEVDSPRWATRGRDGWPHCCNPFLLHPLSIFIMLGTSIIPAFLWLGNWMSQTCLTNLLSILLCPLSMVLTFSEKAWGVFHFVWNVLSGLFCPMTSYISFCLRMFFCLLVWLRGQGWIEAEPLVPPSMKHTNATLILRSSVSKGDKCPQEKD